MEDRDRNIELNKQKGYYLILLFSQMYETRRGSMFFSKEHREITKAIEAIQESTSLKDTMDIYSNTEKILLENHLAFFNYVVDARLKKYDSSKSNVDVRRTILKDKVSLLNMPCLNDIYHMLFWTSNNNGLFYETSREDLIACLEEDKDNSPTSVYLNALSAFVKKAYERKIPEEDILDVLNEAIENLIHRVGEPSILPEDVLVEDLEDDYELVSDIVLKILKR